jgi:hypothetical protein
MHRPISAATMAAIAASLVALSAFTPPPARTAVADSFTITIGGGPHAGHYTLNAANMLCMRSHKPDQFSAAYKDPAAHDPKMVSGAGINVFKPDDPGPKQGQVNLSFGDPEDKRPQLVNLFIPTDSKGPLTLTKDGAAVTVTFKGRTKSGIELSMSATCTDVMEF